MLRVLQWERDTGAMQRLRTLGKGALRPALMMAAMFLMMRFELPMQLSPLAAALMAAGLASGESAAALVAGGLLGALRLPLTDAALLPAICCAAVLAGELICLLIPALKRGAEETRVSLVAGLGVLLPSLVWAGGDALNSLWALACAALSATAAPFLLPALRLRSNRRRHVPTLPTTLKSFPRSEV